MWKMRSQFDTEGWGVGVGYVNILTQTHSCVNQILFISALASFLGKILMSSPEMLSHATITPPP